MIDNGDDVTSVCTSNITDFSRLFFVFRNSNTANNFNQDISKWDVSNGSNFNEMFAGSSSFNYNLNGWDVSSAISWSNFNNSSFLTDDNIPPRFFP
jgi:hypothetical protein